MSSATAIPPGAEAPVFYETDEHPHPPGATGWAPRAAPLTLDP